VTKSSSKAVRGFNRLGLVLAVPVLIAALVILVIALLSNDGPIVADPTAKAPPLPVRTVTSEGSYGSGWEGSTNLANIDAERERARIRTGDNKSFTAITIETGPVRTFAFYWVEPTKQNRVSEEMVSAVVESIGSFERRRGVVISAKEQPVLVGWNILVRESAEPQRTYVAWSHLKRGFDWEKASLAGALAAFAILIYLIARALGWIVDGFISDPEK
jgi:hypothetical protein